MILIIMPMEWGWGVAVAGSAVLRKGFVVIQRLCCLQSFRFAKGLANDEGLSTTMLTTAMVVIVMATMIMFLMPAMKLLLSLLALSNMWL